MEITQEEALRRYPVLHALLHVREAGWTFYLIPDGEGSIDGVVAMHNKRQWVDAICLYGEGAVVGMRLLGDVLGGGTVWSKNTGTLVEIVHELLNLPDPDDRLAPKLVKASGPARWTP